MYAANHCNDDPYIPDRDNARATVKAVTSETNA